MRTSYAIAGLAVFFLTACGPGEQEPGKIMEPENLNSGTIKITTQASPESDPVVTTVECSDKLGFCEDLLSNTALKPVPPDTGCTLQYGGPERAEVSGFISNEQINDLTFTRTNGCEIARWDELQKLLDTLTPPVTLPGGAGGGA